MWATSGLIYSLLGLILLYGTTAEFRFPNEGQGRSMPRTRIAPPPPRGTRHFTGGSADQPTSRYLPQTRQKQVTGRQNRFRFPIQRQPRSHLQTSVQRQVTSRQHPRPRVIGYDASPSVTTGSESPNNYLPSQTSFPAQGHQLGQSPFHHQRNIQPQGHAQVPVQQHIYTETVHIYHPHGSQFNPGNVQPPHVFQNPSFEHPHDSQFNPGYVQPPHVGRNPSFDQPPPAVQHPQVNSNGDPWLTMFEVGAGVAERVAMAGLDMGFRALAGDGFSDGYVEPPYNLRDPNAEYSPVAELPQEGLTSSRNPRRSNLADLVAGLAISGITSGVKMLAGGGLDGVPRIEHRAFG